MNKVFDFVVVGAGISGLYVAWRLASAFPRKTVLVYEATGRIGGRLLTETMPGMPFPSELGGMRYTTKHLLLAGVIKELGLRSKDFKFDQRLFYLRGHHLVPSCTPPYRLRAEEERKGPDDLVRHAIRLALLDLQPAQNNTKMRWIRRKLLARLRDDKQNLDFFILTPDEWAYLKRHAILHGSYLYDVGFWNVLQFYLSSEAFLYAHDALGYESILANWNAAEAITWFLKDFGVGYRTVIGGMYSVPDKVASRLEDLCPGSLLLFRELTSIVQIRRSLFRLSFRVREPNKEKSTVERIKVRKVILALPKEPLKKIAFGKVGIRGAASSDRRDQLDELFDSVTAHNLFKLFLGYERVWWIDPRALGCPTGRAVADLPIRQVYYFGGNEKDVPGMLMASYSDAHYVDFWKPLHIRPAGRARPASPYSPYYTGKADLTEKEETTLRAYGATENMVRKAHRQVTQLHPELGEANIPKPYVALVMDWSVPPYYGGWHTWNVRREPWKDMRRIIQPFARNPEERDADLYICGEAYSNEQGWVEGALKSAETVLRKLGVGPPPWIANLEYRKLRYRGYSDYIR